MADKTGIIAGQVNQTAAQNQPRSFGEYMARPEIKSLLAGIIGENNVQTFTTSVISAVQCNAKLGQCSAKSIINAALIGETLKLSPSPQMGQFYIIPYQNKGAYEAQFQLGYKGYIQLAERSGAYHKLNVVSIKEGELVRYDPLNEEIEVNLIEDENVREATPTIGYYAMFEYTSGFRKAIYWSKEKMLSHADRYSKAFSVNATSGQYPKVSYADYVAGKYPKADEWKYSSFWYKDFDTMAHKTMLRQLISKWGIMSLDMQTAMYNDMMVFDENGDKSYADNDNLFGSDDVIPVDDFSEVANEQDSN